MVLRAQVVDKIEQLLPLTTLGMDWRPVFAREAAKYRQIGNGRPSASDERRDAYAWSSAYEFVLRERRA